jgi:Bacteriophage HK97-gp10, putative tail-component
LHVTSEVRHVFNAAEMQRILTGRDGGVARDMLRRGYRVRTAAQRRCPVDHGRLRASIVARLISVNGVTICEVGTDVEYAVWVHEGTGLYGPRHALIYPKTAKALVFTPRKANGAYIKRGDRSVVIVRSTKGMKGIPFMRDALPAARG